MDELAERCVVPERVEVAVFLRDVTEARPPLESDLKVSDRVLLAAGQRLAAGEVVERGSVPTRLERLSRALDHRVVVARLVRRMELRPYFPSARLIRLPDRAADRKHCRPGLVGKRGPVSLRPDEHECALEGVDGVAVDLEPRTAAKDDVEL